MIDGQRGPLSRVGYDYLISNVRERDNCFINNASDYLISNVRERDNCFINNASKKR